MNAETTAHVPKIRPCIATTCSPTLVLATWVVQFSFWGGSRTSESGFLRQGHLDKVIGSRHTQLGDRGHARCSVLRSIWSEECYSNVHLCHSDSSIGILAHFDRWRHAHGTSTCDQNPSPIAAIFGCRRESRRGRVGPRSTLAYRAACRCRPCEIGQLQSADV